MVKPSGNPVFESIGGCFQYRIRTPRDLARILELDPALWAALCVPVSALNGDRAFFQALDGDGNGMIRVDEVRAAVRWLLEMLGDGEILLDTAPECTPDAIRKECADGTELLEFIGKHKKKLLADGKLTLPNIRAVLAERLSGPLSGNGVLSAAAAAGTGAETLFADIVKLSGGTPDAAGAPGVSAALLDQFLADARSFLDWAKGAEPPLFRGSEAVAFDQAAQALTDKLDEYFRFCELVRLDPANAARFRLDPAALPALDIHDPAAVDLVLKSAPLAAPTPDCRLDFGQVLNPAFRDAAEKFAQFFAVQSLTKDEWDAIKNDLAPYRAYLEKAQGDLAGTLGKERLEAILAGEEPEFLRKRLAEDSALGGVIGSLRKLERLLLYKQYLIEFADNFVSFAALFDPKRASMMQAGRLVMDGRSYHLSVWIDSVAAHKTIAQRSHLCMIYLEVTSSLPGATARRLAVAVTGGSLTRIYVGKPAFFVDRDGVTYHGKVVDLVEGPISFGQTVAAPFRRISEAIGGKIEKLTDFSSTEKQLTSAVDSGKLPPAPAAPAAQQPAQKGFLGNGSMFLLAGGLSVAALGAAASFILKSLSSFVATLSALPGWKLLLWLLVLIAIFLVPAMIFAYLKMRKRSLTVFLEAGGWAVNLPIRLNFYVSGLFTRSGKFPAGSRLVIVRETRRNWFWWVMLALVIVAALLWASLRYGWFEPKEKESKPSCFRVKTEQTVTKPAPAPAPAQPAAPVAPAQSTAPAQPAAPAQK